MRIQKGADVALSEIYGGIQEAVSYTHLDVYKRQVISFNAKLWSVFDRSVNFSAGFV